MTKPLTTLPVVASLPFAHLVMRLCAVPGGGVSFGLQSQVEAEAGKPVEFCGFADAGTARELRAIADAIEGAAR